MCGLLCQCVEPGQTRLRREGEGVVICAQHPEQPSHLAKSLGGGPLDRVERAPRFIRILVEEPGAAPPLEDDHADRMCNDVVELARDPRPLLCDGRSRALLALTFEHDGTVFEERLPQTARANQAADDERAADDNAEEHEPAEVDPIRVGRSDEDPERRRETDRNERRASPRVGAGRVEADEDDDSECFTFARVREPEVRHRRGDQSDEQHKRPPAAPDQEGQEQHPEHTSQCLLG